MSIIDNAIAGIDEATIAAAEAEGRKVAREIVDKVKDAPVLFAVGRGDETFVNVKMLEQLVINNTVQVLTGAAGLDTYKNLLVNLGDTAAAARLFVEESEPADGNDEPVNGLYL